MAPAEHIRNIGSVLMLQLKNGGLALLAPADFVFWTKRLADKVNAFETTISKMNGVSGKELWITGKFSQTARTHFEGKGWKLKENANEILLKKN